ncbi:MAG: glycosyltransferase, partial [Candidatus Peregrinibacteria bacterium]
GGAESVFSAFHALYPEAPIFTTLYRPEKMRELGNLPDVRTSWLQKLPKFVKHQWLLGQMPVAVEMMNLDDFDVVLSSCHSVSKGVITKPNTLHICYCHTPMRYAWEEWDLESRLKKFPRILHGFIRRKVKQIRDWDICAAQRVDKYIANSRYIAEKIKEHYYRTAEVIYPPVHSEQFKPVTNPSEDYYFSVGRLIPYKKFDLLVETFNRLKLPLKIAGTGSELKKLKRAAGPTVEVLGYVSDSELADLYANCKAFLFPQMEDAGIVPLEAMSAGRPVIAYNKGGSLDTMADGKTGVLFSEQTVESLSDAIRRSEKKEFDPRVLRQHAQQFDVEVFKKKMADYVEKALRDFNASSPL